MRLRCPSRRPLSWPLQEEGPFCSGVEDKALLISCVRTFLCETGGGSGRPWSRGPLSCAPRPRPRPRAEVEKCVLHRPAATPGDLCGHSSGVSWSWTCCLPTAAQAEAAPRRAVPRPVQGGEVWAPYPDQWALSCPSLQDRPECDTHTASHCVPLT